MKSLHTLLAWIVLVCVHLQSRADQPVIEKVPGLPLGAHRYSDAALGSSGWAFGSSDGLVVSSGENSWALAVPPKGSDIRIVLSLPRGHLVAGSGFCLIHSAEAWIDTRLVDEFVSGVTIDGVALLTGRKGLYQINPDGRSIILKELHGSESARVFAVNGKAILFGVKDGIWRWTPAGLVNVEKEFAWADKLRVVSIQQLQQDAYLAATNQGFMIVRKSGSEAVLSEISAGLLKKGVISAHLFGDTIVVATYYGGLDAYSTNGAHLWTIDSEGLGGNVNFAKQYIDGMIVGTTGSVLVIPNPNQFTKTPLPSGEVYFSGRYRTGVIVGTSTGVVVLEGECPVPSDWKVFSLIEELDGKFVAGGFGKVSMDGQMITVMGREVTRVVQTNEKDFAILQPHGISILEDGKVTALLDKLPAVPNSLTAIDGKTLLIGTADGAVISNTRGQVTAKFGEGTTKVFALKNRVLVGDAKGVLYDGTGSVVAETPFAEFLDVAEVNTKTFMLGRTSDGICWMIELSESGEIHSIDIPLPRLPQRIVAGSAGLYVIGSDSVIKYADIQNARPLESSGYPTLVVGGKYVDGVRSNLPSGVESVGLLLPPVRLWPWTTPRYSYRVGDGEWTRATPGTISMIQRLHYGHSVVQVHADWATGNQTASLDVFRSYPWWAKWWAISLYVVVVSIIVVAIVRFRTLQIARRAQELESALDKKTSELKKALRAREDFFSTMSHEIRNPLNGVVGLCDMLDEADPGAVSSRERFLVRTLRGCAAQLRTTLDDVLDFSRIDRGDIQLREDVFELRAAIEGSARSINPKLEQVRIDIPAESLWLLGDSGKLRQVVCNLISNALKYGSPKMANVVVTTMQEGPMAALAISVRNTGATIPIPEQEKIFEGFSRGEDALRKRIPGSGIGLAVSRRMARAMGGDLKLKSENGLTEFSFTIQLPIEQAPVQKDSATRAMERVSKALAIEDEDYNRLVLGNMLKNLGYEVDWAIDGASAIERVKTGSYDLVLTDFMLPDTTGVELAPKLLALMKDPKPPIIAVTAYSTKDKVEQARAAGIDGFVTKPVDIASLRAAIVSAAPIIPLRQRFDVQANGRWDFEQMLKLNDGKQFLAEYAQSLPGAWKSVLTHFENDGTPNEKAAKAVHAFISRVLAVYAEDISAQLKLLEESAAQAAAPESQKLISVITPMVEDLAKAAAERALSD